MIIRIYSGAGIKVNGEPYVIRDMSMADCNGHGVSGKASIVARGKDGDVEIQFEDMLAISERDLFGLVQVVTTG